MNHRFRIGFASLWLAIAPAAFAQSGYWGNESTEARQLEAQYAAKKGTMGRAAHAMVAACHNRSVDIALAILKRGGSAADAFIAATFADYVQSPGASSLGGPMGALAHDAKSGKVAHISAPLKTVRDPAGQWRIGETALGKQVLVPGAVAGLELLHRQHGKLPWRELVEPARRLAAEGFAVDYMYAAIVANAVATLRISEYGRQTFLHAEGKPLAAGETLKLPVLAATLAGIARDGAAYFRKGEWVDDAVREVQAAGGKLAREDFADYAATSGPALRVEYRGHTVYGPSLHDSGGARLALALRVMENADLRKLGHYSESLDALETLARVVRGVAFTPEFSTHAFFDDPAAVQAFVNGDRAAAIWKDVQDKVDRGPAPTPGSHSYSVVVVDAAGNAVTGTHTIESMPFGSGIFVRGVPLNNTGQLHPYVEGSPYTTPVASYLVEPLSATLAFRGRERVLASSVFSAALWPADLQLVTSVLDFDWTPERVALTPRLGSFAIDFAKLTADMTTMSIDKRFNAATVADMNKRGIRLTQAGYVDTGMLVLVKRDPKSGELTGFTPEQLPDGRASGY